MSLADDELARAEQRSAESRKALADTVVALQARLKPAALARDAVAELKEIGGDMAQSGVETVKRHPIPTMGVVAVLTAYLARKPLRRLFHRQPSDT